MVLVTVFAVVGCTKPAETPAANTEPAVEQAATDETATDGADAAAPAELEDKVVVYSTHGEDMLELVATEFEKETGVKVEFINLKGELADRVRAEAENPQSDVMFGAASSVFLELKEENLFEPFAPSWADQINPLFKDSENYFFGTIQTPVVMFYNTDVIAPEDAPKDWSDLADEKYRGQLVFRNVLSSSARATFAALLQQYEKQGDLQAGWDYLAAVDANTKQYYGSGSLQFQAIGRKEAGISYATLSSVIDNRVDNGMPLEIVNATSGSPVITDCIGLIKNAQHPNAAKAFIEFAGGEKIQTLYANEFNRMPTHPEAIKNAPEWMSEIELNIMDVDWGALSKSQSEWMQKWDSEIKDTQKDVE
ncbi:MAG: extracellular solute-binding protein [Clostridia bacterium]|nr:extracellular solute-binding protein [Clostridia bacterium]